MKTDEQIQQDVINQLKWEPFLTSSEIGVAVRNGVVTLSGHVDTYAKKYEAEKAAGKVSGVKAIAEDIQVGISPGNQRSDADIAEAVVNALRWHTAIQEDKIKIKVDSGVVILQGEVEWSYQKTAALNAIIYLTGVKSVTNLITIKPKLNAAIIEQKISAAFQRHASLDASKINVSISDSRVILNGTVRSLAESEDANDAAWAAPGVREVENNLSIEEGEYVY